MNTIQEYIQAFRIIEQEMQKASNKFRDCTSISPAYCKSIIQALRVLRETARTCIHFIGMSFSQSATFIRIELQDLDGDTVARLILEVDDFRMKSVGGSNSAARITAHVGLEKKLARLSKQIQDLIAKLEQQAPAGSTHIVEVIPLIEEHRS